MTDCSQHHQLHRIQRASRSLNRAAPHSVFTFGTAVCSTCPSIPRHLFEAESCCQRGAEEQKKPHLLVVLVLQKRSNTWMDLLNPRHASSQFFKLYVHFMHIILNAYFWWYSNVVESQIQKLHHVISRLLCQYFKFLLHLLSTDPIFRHQNIPSN